VLLPSHRSYLDPFIGSEIFHRHGIGMPFEVGGANLDFFPFGTLAKRTGMIFIPRRMADAPVYRVALRGYIGHLARQAANLTWSIEGGRTRTGKLRPPVYGILKYLVDAVEAVDGPEIYLGPVSVVYDQLHEVAAMTAEARGGHKKPEDVRWMVRLIRQQRQRLGRAYVDIGELLPLRQRLAELQRAQADEGNIVERLAVEICHRINRATPITPTAMATLALLGADRALTLDEVLATVQPLAAYVRRRRRPVAGGADMSDRATIRRALQDLVSSGVLTSYDGGVDTVWAIAPDQHLIAAFYRNTIIHVLIERAIGEVAALAAADCDEPRQALVDAALHLRDLLKFEFFFPPRDDFLAELATELGPPPAGEPSQATGADPVQWLQESDLLLAHLVLRPFLDAYSVVADCLAEHGDRSVEEEPLLRDCLRVAHPWALQRRLARAESVSLELFKNAVRIARHRQLLDVSGAELAERRKQFAAEVHELIGRVETIAELARSRRGTQ
jgi:glycerol-3-phosphate O-acyltransferase